MKYGASRITFVKTRGDHDDKDNLITLVCLLGSCLI
jgi:hypothetical protein